MTIFTYLPFILVALAITIFTVSFLLRDKSDSWRIVGFVSSFFAIGFTSASFGLWVVMTALISEFEKHRMLNTFMKVIGLGVFVSWVNVAIAAAISVAIVVLRPRSHGILISIVVGLIAGCVGPNGMMLLLWMRSSRIPVDFTLSAVWMGLCVVGSVISWKVGNRLFLKGRSAN